MQSVGSYVASTDPTGQRGQGPHFSLRHGDVAPHSVFAGRAGLQLFLWGSAEGSAYCLKDLCHLNLFLS